MRRILPISLLIMAIWTPWARADVVIIVRRQAESSGSYVRICDIARVEGPRDRAAEVAETIIGPTPPKGQTLEISRWEIESRLYEMGVDAKITFSGNDSVRVFGNGAQPSRSAYDDIVLDPIAPVTAAKREPVTVAPQAPAVKQPDPAVGVARLPQTDADPAARDRIGIAVAKFLSSRYSRKDVEVRAKVLSLSGEISSGEDFAVTEALSGKVPGKAEFALVVRNRKDGSNRQVTAVLDAEVYALAPIANKPLYKGTVISEKDVAIARVKMKSGQAYLPPNPKSAEGREAQRSIKAGEPILADDVKSVSAVKQGSIVLMESAGKAWTVQSRPKALASGNVDDIITVEDTAKRIKYQARITGPNKVTVVVPANNR